MAVMGSDSDGPLGLLRTKKESRHSQSVTELELWDIQTMAPINFKKTIQFGDKGITVSADGRTFCGISKFADGLQTLRLDGNVGVIHKGDLGSPRSVLRINSGVPNYDGSLIFCGSSGVRTYNRQLADRYKFSVLLPTSDPRYAISIHEGRITRPLSHLKPRKKFVTIRDSTQFKSLYELEGFDVVGSFVGPYYLGTEKRVAKAGMLGNEPAIRFLPDLKLLVSIPLSRDSIDFRKFDLKHVLDGRKAPYLHAVSRPPAVAKVGDQIEYQIEALTNAKNVSYKLDTGPEGMTVSSTGKVIWPVNKVPANGVASAVVQLEADNGKTTLHKFEIHVDKEVVVEIAKSDQTAGRIYYAPSKLDSAQKVLLFDEAFTDVRYGGAGRFGIFHFTDSKKIRIIDLYTGQQTGSFSVTDNVLFAANRKDLIVVHPTERKLDRWSLSTGTKISTGTFVSEVDPSVAVMGASGDGPLAIWGSGEVQLFDSCLLYTSPSPRDS